MNIKTELTALSSSIKPQNAPSKVNTNGNGGDFAGILKHTEARQSEAAAELERYAKMSPQERMAVAIRKKLGISEEEYAAMSPEQKKAVDAKVGDLIKQEIDKQMAESQRGVVTNSGMLI